ncbi:MAG: hypothetical protein LBU68_02680 [Rickettsiales bacterium]|nr:hypothetical protein [Rickettsiales bacterium]
MNKNRTISPQILRTKKLQNLRRIFLMIGVLTATNGSGFVNAQTISLYLKPNSSCVTKCGTPYIASLSYYTTSNGVINYNPSSSCLDFSSDYSSCVARMKQIYTYSVKNGSTLNFYNIHCAFSSSNPNTNTAFSYVYVAPGGTTIASRDSISAATLKSICKSNGQQQINLCNQECNSVSISKTDILPLISEQKSASQILAEMNAVDMAKKVFDAATLQQVYDVNRIIYNGQ